MKHQYDEEEPYHFGPTVWSELKENEAEIVPLRSGSSGHKKIIKKKSYKKNEAEIVP